MRMLLAVAAGGALGSVMRYMVAVALGHWLGFGFPWGTLAVNVAGSFAMGLLVELGALVWQPAPELRALLVVGVLGGFTTFSAFGGDTLALAQGGAWRLVALNVAANVGLGLAAVWAGRAVAVAALGR